MEDVLSSPPPSGPLDYFLSLPQEKSLLAQKRSMPWPSMRMAENAKKELVTMPVEYRGARSSHNIPAVDSVEILPIFHKLLEDKRSTPIVGGSR